MKLDFGTRALRPIGVEQMSAARRLAQQSPRHRAIVRYHSYEEGVQRMLHAIEPESYVRPHQHANPPKTEVFLAVAGAALICSFEDGGEVRESFEICASGPRHGVEIPPGVWHGLFAIEPGTVLYELIEGSYDPSSHKSYAQWAPAEGSAEAPAFLRELRSRAGLPPVARR